MLVKRVLLVDHQPLYRAGLRAALNQWPHLRISGEAGSGHDAIHLADAHRPHLILLDAHLPGLTGTTVARVLRHYHPSCRLLLTAERLDHRLIREAAAAGVDDLFIKARGERDLLLTVQRVLTLKPAEPGSTAPGAIEATASQEDRARGPRALSPREIEVLDCVVQGRSNKEIAAALYLTEQTVKNHMTSIMKKCAVDDRVQALLFAVRSGWVDLGPHASVPSRGRHSA